MRTASSLALLASAALIAVGGTTLALAGDGGDGATPPTSGMCAPEVPDCTDTVVVPGGDGPTDPAGTGGDPDDGSFDSDAARTEARATLGLAEGELGADVRVARRGEEHFALTEDYVLGRLTVELDADAEGTYRVVAVRVELPEGPEAFTAS